MPSHKPFTSICAVFLGFSIFAFASDKKSETKPAETSKPSYELPQPATETIDLTMYQRIREEGLSRSHIMEYASGLMDGIGSRLTGWPNLKRANEWTRDQFTAMGCVNAHLEDWGEFGMGWRQLNTSVRMSAPDTAVFIAQAVPWSASSHGPVSGSAIWVDAKDEKDLDKYKGQLAGKIVFFGEMRDVKPVDKALSERLDDANLKTTAEYPIHVGEHQDYISGFFRGMQFREKAGKFFSEEHAAGPDIYGAGASEEFLGRALGPRRSEVLIATKFGMKMDEQRRGARPEYVRQATEDSLRRLGTDRIDLYQLHEPDPEVPIAETLGALDNLVRAGKVREIGCANFSGDQLRAAEAAVHEGGARFVSVQNQYSLVHREPETDVMPECVRAGIALPRYSPLANALLTGKYRRGQPLPEGSRARDGFGPKVFTDENLALVESLSEFAAARGHTMLELAVSWLAAQPAVASVIAGAKSPEQVKSNSSAAGWRLAAPDLAAIEAILPRAQRAQ